MSRKRRLPIVRRRGGDTMSVMNSVALVSPVIAAIIEAFNDGRVRVVEAQLLVAKQQAEAVESAMKFNAQQAIKYERENIALKKEIEVLTQRVRELEEQLIHQKGGEA